MYAVIRTGGKQYRVLEGEIVRVERLPGKVGGKVTFKEVLVVGENGSLKIGAPTLPKAKVAGSIVAHSKAKKVTVFKFKKNSQYKILRGHRQPFTDIMISEITAE